MRVGLANADGDQQDVHTMYSHQRLTHGAAQEPLLSN